MKIQNNWIADSKAIVQNGFGNIVFMETGSGKTYIAVKVIQHMLNDEFE